MGTGLGLILFSPLFGSSCSSESGSWSSRVYTEAADGSEVGYREILGVDGLAMAVIEKVDRMKATIPIEIQTTNAYSAGIPLNVHRGQHQGVLHPRA